MELEKQKNPLLMRTLARRIKKSKEKRKKIKKSWTIPKKRIILDLKLQKTKKIKEEINKFIGNPACRTKKF